jgi:DNA-binding CsgD family transcriptional regulator
MIADVTGHSAETIHGQVKDLRAKLAAKNSAHAVAVGFRRGLIQ